mmetsp:Transcript_12030/g.28225  ORF Transcript_12030/g.28225 Transcript_12030/m.28225 type:complete len:225 (+) Transcript_12030:104-778(+)
MGGSSGLSAGHWILLLACTGSIATALGEADTCAVDGCGGGEVEEMRVELLQVGVRLAARPGASSTAPVDVGGSEEKSRAAALRPASTLDTRSALNASQDVAAGGIWKPRVNGSACPLLWFETGDNGCCPPASISTGKHKCVRINCENILRYACGLNTTEKPKCVDRHNIFSNKEIDRKCTLEDKTCTFVRYDWATRHIPILNSNKGDKLEHDCDWPSDENPIVR